MKYRGYDIYYTRYKLNTKGDPLVKYGDKTFFINNMSFVIKKKGKLIRKGIIKDGYYYDKDSLIDILQRKVDTIIKKR